MKKVRYIPWILMSEGVGILSAVLSTGGMQRYAGTVQEPPLTPPGWVFFLAWTALYALMGIGAARVDAMEPAAGRSRGLNLFVAQLAVNFLWSPIFFNSGRYGFALLWLLLLLFLAVAMTATLYRVDKTAGLLQIPYLLWLCFAAYLNYGVWQLNR